MASIVNMQDSARLARHRPSQSPRAPGMLGQALAEPTDKKPTNEPITSTKLEVEENDRLSKYKKAIKNYCELMAVLCSFMAGGACFGYVIRILFRTNTFLMQSEPSESWPEAVMVTVYMMAGALVGAALCYALPFMKA